MRRRNSYLNCYSYNGCGVRLRYSARQCDRRNFLWTISGFDPPIRVHFDMSKFLRLGFFFFAILVAHLFALKRLGLASSTLKMAWEPHHLQHARPLGGNISLPYACKLFPSEIQGSPKPIGGKNFTFLNQRAFRNRRLMTGKLFIETSSLFA